MPQFSSIFILLLTSPLALAQPSVVRQLSLHPAAAPVPALKYQLLPEVIDQTPGNAAQYYYRALLPEAFSHRRQKDIDEKMERLKKTPLKDLSRDELNFMPGSSLRDCDLGARCEWCDWELSTRLRKGGIGTLTPELQSTRELTKLLVLRSRLELAEGHHDQAIRTFQTSLSLSRHVGNSPSLIALLVGKANAIQTLLEVEEFLQTPNAPNLYWALTAIPRPYFDLKKGLQGDKLMFDVEFSKMKLFSVRTEFEFRPFTGKELEDLENWVIELCKYSEKGELLEKDAVKKKLAADVERLAPEARKSLIASGRKAKEIGDLPALQVVVADALRVSNQISDDSVKLAYLPFWQAKPLLEKMQEKIKEARPTVLQSFVKLVPPHGKIFSAPVSLDRHIACLRCIEAIRMYAASHQGKLPNALADITEVPIPIDPVTGKDFEYKRDGEKAILIGPTPKGETATVANTLHFEIVMAK